MTPAAVRAFFAAAAFAGDFNTPFDDAIAYHRQKVNLPTRSWRDIEGRAHDRAFVVAGVTKLDMLADINKEVDNAIAKGETLRDFQKRFDEIALKNGWLADRNAKVRAWRARVVYETNLRTANQAGRWKQLRDPAVMKLRPYWQYVHAETREPVKPRPMHLAWDGLIVLATDPWWNTHFGPNGWLCTCGVRALSVGDLKRMGKSPDKAPDDGTSFVLNRTTGEFEEVPNGIDPGWDHAPGADWAAGLAPAPAEPQKPPESAPEAQAETPDIAPEPNKPLPSEERPGFLAAVREFFDAFVSKFRSADNAEATDVASVLFADALGEPVALSLDMFRRGREIVGSQALADDLPAIGAAMRAPNEIQLAWIECPGDRARKELARIYVGETAVVTWTRSWWRYGAAAPEGGSVSWKAGAA